MKYILIIMCLFICSCSYKDNREDYNNMAFKLMEQGGIKLVKKYKEGNIYAK